MSILCRLRCRSVAVTSGLRTVTASRGARVDAGSVPSRLRALLHNSDGSTMFETAVTSSILLVPVLFGIFSVAMALITYQQLGYATMRSTQHLAYGRNIIADPCATAAADVTASLPALNPSNFTYTVNITSTSGTTDTVNTYGPYTGTAASTCPAGGTSLNNATLGANGNPVILHVTYVYNWFPIFGDRITGTLASADAMLVE
jgi:Flp pilus assembly protein TadG